MNSADSNYDHNASAPGGPPPAWAYLRPFDSNEERLVMQATEIYMLPNAEIQQVVRPPLPQIVLFPPRFGYKQTQPGLQDIIEVARDVRVSDAFSGGPGSYSGSARNIQGSW